MIQLSTEEKGLQPQLKAGIHLAVIKSVKGDIEFVTKRGKGYNHPNILLNLANVPTAADPTERASQQRLFPVKKYLKVDPEDEKNKAGFIRYTTQALHIYEMLMGGAKAAYADAGYTAEDLQFDNYADFIAWYEKAMAKAIVNEDGSPKMFWLLLSYEGERLNIPTFPNFCELYKEGVSHSLVWNENRHNLEPVKVEAVGGAPGAPTGGPSPIPNLDLP